MNYIIGDSIVSCYADACSILVMMVLLLLSDQLRKRKSLSLRIFYYLSLSVTAACLFDFIFHMSYKQSGPSFHTAAIISRTMWEWLVFLIMMLWVAYVNCKLYGPQKQIPFVHKLIFVPFVLYTVLLAVNLHKNILFSISSDNLCTDKPLSYVFVAVEFVCFIASAVSVWFYDRKNINVRFIRVMPMILSVVLAISLKFFLPYEIDILGFVIGLALLYFSMISEFRFIDEESGMFSKRYLTNIMDIALSDQRVFRSALIFEPEGNMEEAFEILRNETHRFGDILRVDSNRFLMFTEQDNLSMIQMWASVVTEAAEKYNAESPENPVAIKARVRLRENNEDVFAFINATVEDRESGSYLRDMTSMMEDLDRLDNELSLASDIQLSMLPMNFPAFPGRTEFDLYASMTPAKEVGGDFYDFFLVDNDHLAMVIADVSGKGIPAALCMMVSKTLIKNQLMSGCSPAEALDHVNVQLCDRNSSMMFVTVWLAVLEISSGKGMACNAGHEHPGLRRADGSFELLKYRHCVFLGINKDAAYQNREFVLRPGDCVFVYTDGVPEAVNTKDEMFGGERLVDTLNEDADASPKDLICRMHKTVNRFAGSAEQFDDITMLCVKYLG